ncbi:unnamed protein product [Diplocarpon coronariae]|uniref:Uncharacterized protein n=1 Tax=Diplocarpon coronariae TaxID=2795749 RepID=A0A218ZEE4_9HELO|nr:hypothetical protein B2J93_1694 [Marssonina coronariae]
MGDSPTTRFHAPIRFHQHNLSLYNPDESAAVNTTTPRSRTAYGRLLPTLGVENERTSILVQILKEFDFTNVSVTPILPRTDELAKYNCYGELHLPPGCCEGLEYRVRVQNTSPSSMNPRQDHREREKTEQLVDLKIENNNGHVYPPRLSDDSAHYWPTGGYSTRHRI